MKHSDILNQRTGALYVRVSTDKQEELSPDSQIKLGMDFAKQHNIYIPPEYIFRDDGISGKKADKRPSFSNLIGLAKSKEHPIDCILVWKFSRFARNQEESIVYKSMLSRDKVEVISISEPLPEGPFGSLIERIIEWMDEYYLTNLSSEVIRGMTEKAKRGQYQAQPPIGYKFAGHNLPPVQDPDTLIIPSTIQKMFLTDQLTTRQIALKLNAMGYRTKHGNLFDARDIRYILENPFYAGKSRWNYSGRGRELKDSSEVIIADGNWEPLYDWDTYLAIQDRLASLDSANASHGKRKRDVSACKHWLSGMLICSSCGHTLAYSGSGKNIGFQCWRYTKGMCPTSHYIGIPLLENNVIQTLEGFLLADSINYTIVYKNASGDDKVQELKTILTKLSEKERRIKDAYLNGIDSIDEYKENKQKLQTERDRVQKELSAFTRPPLDKKECDKLMLQNIENALAILTNENSDYTQKGAAIRNICDNIIFDRKDTNLDIFLKLVF